MIYIEDMAIEIKVPTLGESISEATIAKITKKVGEFAKKDELLMELETDKVTLEINSPEAGVIEALEVKEGDSVIVGQIIGKITQSDSVSSAPSPVVGAVQTAPAAPHSELSPSVRKISEEEGIDFAGKTGSGKDGRLTKEDAINFALNKQSPATLQAADDRIEERIRMSKLRQTIAKRLKDSQNTAAILTTFNEVDMSAVMELRKTYQDAFTKKFGIKLGFMSFFIKACVEA